MKSQRWTCLYLRTSIGRYLRVSWPGEQYGNDEAFALHAMFTWGFIRKSDCFMRPLNTQTNGVRPIGRRRFYKPPYGSMRYWETPFRHFKSIRIKCQMATAFKEHENNTFSQRNAPEIVRRRMSKCRRTYSYMWMDNGHFSIRSLARTICKNRKFRRSFVVDSNQSCLIALFERMNENLFAVVVRKLKFVELEHVRIFQKQKKNKVHILFRRRSQWPLSY